MISPKWRLLLRSAILGLGSFFLVLFFNRTGQESTPLLHSNEDVDQMQKSDTSNSSSPVRIDQHGPFWSDFLVGKNAGIPYNDRPPLPPLQVLQEYMAQHSQAALQLDWERNQTKGRLFSIVHYSCPHQLGNRLHHFYNDFLLAVLTNRTILWRFWDRASCIQLGNQYDHNLCGTDGTTSLLTMLDDPAASCRGILQTAPWIASYEEWAMRLGLADPTQVWIRSINQHNAPEPPPPGVARISWSSFWLENMQKDHPFVVFQPLVGVLSASFVHKFLLLKDSIISNHIFAYGPEFWHGLLFDQAFRVDPAFRATLSSVETTRNRSIPTNMNNKSGVAIALHARHTDPHDNGGFVTDELDCLKTLVKGPPCRVYLLSDRTATLERLSERMGRDSLLRDCQIFTTRQPETTVGLEVEHGPYAGAGFVRDLFLAAEDVTTHGRAYQAAWIGNSHRSSSQLLHEWVIYRRALQAWKDHGTDPADLPPLPTCELPNQN